MANDRALNAAIVTSTAGNPATPPADQIFAQSQAVILAQLKQALTNSDIENGSSPMASTDEEDIVEIKDRFIDAQNLGPLLSDLKVTETKVATIFDLRTAADQTSQSGHIARIDPNNPFYKYLVPFLIASGTLIEVADVMTSLILANRPYYIVFPTSAIAFFVQFKLLEKPIKQSVEELFDLISKRSIATKNNRNLPMENEEFPDLPDAWDEYKATAVGLIVGTFGAFSLGSLGSYLMATIPQDFAFADVTGWKIFAGFTTVCYVLNSLLSETMTTWKSCRNTLAGASKPPARPFLYALALSLVGAFAIINAAADGASISQGISTTWNIKPRSVLYWTTTLLSLILSGGPKLIFEGSRIIEGAYDTLTFCGNLITGQARITKQIALCTLLSLGLCAFLEISKQTINRNFDQGVVDDVFDNPKAFLPYTLVFSYLGVIGGILIGMKSIFADLHKWINSFDAPQAQGAHEMEMQNATAPFITSTMVDFGTIDPQHDYLPEPAPSEKLTPQKISVPAIDVASEIIAMSRPDPHDKTTPLPFSLRNSADLILFTPLTKETGPSLTPKSSP